MLNKNGRGKKSNSKLSEHNQRQVTASDPNEPNSVSKTETNIPQKQVNPPVEGFLLLYREFNNMYIRLLAAFCDPHIFDIGQK